MNKKELRQLYRNKRAQLSDTEVEKMSEAIMSNLFLRFNFSLINSVHVFLPMVNKKEVNTYKIIHHLWEYFPEVKVVVPKMQGDKLESIVLDKTTPLKSNELGIPEPVSSNQINNDELDMVLLPLLAYDMEGNRIGYGKGFYDKFLSDCDKSIIKTGLSFFEPEEAIPAEAFDIPMDFCITPDQMWLFES